MYKYCYFFCLYFQYKMSNVKEESTAKRPKTEADVKTMTNKQYLDQVSTGIILLHLISKSKSILVFNRIFIHTGSF